LFLAITVPCAVTSSILSTNQAPEATGRLVGRVRVQARAVRFAEELQNRIAISAISQHLSILQVVDKA
jgi:hypothetical protein